MLDILEIREHATRAATEGRPLSECPYATTSMHGLLWLDFYFAQVKWLASLSEHNYVSDSVFKTL